MAGATVRGEEAERVIVFDSMVNIALVVAPPLLQARLATYQLTLEARELAQATRLLTQETSALTRLRIVDFNNPKNVVKLDAPLGGLTTEPITVRLSLDLQDRMAALGDPIHGAYTNPLNSPRPFAPGAEFKPATSSGLPLEVTIPPYGGPNDLLVRSNHLFLGGKFVPTSGPSGLSKHHPQSLGQHVFTGTFDPKTGTLTGHWMSTTQTGNHFGRELVSKAIEHVGPQNVKVFTGELGSTNKAVFQAARAKGLTPTEAVWETPIGRTMRDLGFKNATIDEATLQVRFTFE